MEALSYKPVAYYRFDDTAPFQDYSGYNRSGTLVGTETHGISLNADSIFSQKFSTGNYANLGVIPVYVKGKETFPFSIIATVYPVIVSTGGNQQIASHGTNYDGLAINGNTITFSTKYVSSGDAICSYTIQTLQKMDVVGVHTAVKNSLYVNGELVDEVDITPAQQADTFNITDNNFYCGQVSNDQKLLINGLGFYPRVLQPEEITALYQTNNKKVDGSIPKMYGGEEISVNSNSRKPYLNTGWYTNEDWSAATLFGAIVDNDQLSSQMDNGLTLGAVWIDSVDLYNGGTASLLNSVNIWWDGVGETVEASIDGTTWTTVTKGQNLTSIIPIGFDPTNKALYIRITLAAGLDEAYVDYMRVYGFIGNSAVSNNRTLTYNNNVATLDSQVPLDMRDDWGSRIASGGTIVVSADNSGTPAVVRTIEMWVKPDADYASSVGGASSANYQNGYSATNTLPAGQWTLYHRVLSADLVGTVNIAVPGRIGRVAFYDTALTATQVAAIAASYTGVPIVRYTSSSSIAVAESAVPATIYAHDWGIQTA